MEADFNPNNNFSSHRHEWEHVMVWTLYDELKFVGWSAQGKYAMAYVDDLPLHDDTHVKIVYHRAKGRTHSFRVATPEDDHPVENETGRWFDAALLSYE